MWKRTFLFPTRRPIAGDFLLELWAVNCAAPLRYGRPRQRRPNFSLRGRPHIEFPLRDVRMIYQTPRHFGAHFESIRTTRAAVTARRIAVPRLYFQ